MSDFADKVRSLGVLTRGRTRTQVVDGRRPEHDPGIDAGQRCKTTIDELGNQVCESANRQDVNIKAPLIRWSGHVTEERS